MDAHTAHEQSDSVLFVDVRERYEWDAGHIDNSVHIPLMELQQRFAELPRDQRIVAVCQIGQRSELAARFLSQQGFDAHNLEGGMASWQAKDLPFVSDAGSDGEVVDGWARDFDGLLKDRTDPK
jgi:rhodanese-related sulfurtransferase